MLHFLLYVLLSFLSVSAQNTSLDELSKSNGKLYFGSATHNPQFSDEPYTDLLFSDMFGQITAGKSMKWLPTNPLNGTFTYDEGDDVLNRAVAAGQIVRGHNLVWDEELPPWVANLTTNASLIQAMTDHIDSEVTHYKGKLYAWDVVNEPFNDTGTFRDWLYQNVVGTEYIGIAFRRARANDPNAKLYLNEFNLEYGNAKFDFALSTVKDLLAQGVPIDGIGFQGHMTVGQVPNATSLANLMTQFTDLGLEVAITELDVRMTIPGTPTDALLAQQKTDYQTMVQSCMMVEKCVGVTVWDYTDKYSWIPGTFPGQGAACPWDENLVVKPAYDGIIAGMNRALC